MGITVKDASYMVLEKAVSMGDYKVLPRFGIPTKRAIGKYVMDKVTRRMR